MKIKNQKCWWGFFLLLLWVFNTCKSPDSLYEEYIVPNGTYYPGKVKNLRTNPGKERIEIEWTNGADPKVVKARISWDNGTKSIDVDVSKDVGVIRQMLAPMPENTYSFIIRTYDAEGNASVPEEVFGVVYGANYERSLVNRTIRNMEYNKAGVTVENVAFRKPVTQSDFLNESWDASKLTDGIKFDESSLGRWVSDNTGNEHWIEVDLQGSFDINAFQIWVQTSGVHLIPRFILQTWAGGAWVDVYTENNSGFIDPGVLHSQPYYKKFPSVTTNKVRLYFPPHVNNMVRMWEIEVYSENRTESKLRIDWGAAEATETATEIEFSITNGNREKLSVAPSETVTTITDIKIGDPVYYRTMYKPTPLSIDVFSTEAKRLGIEVIANATFGKPVTHSDLLDGFPGKNAVDGNKVDNSSRWVSDDTGNEHWIEIDLQSSLDIFAVELWGGGYDPQDMRMWSLQAWVNNQWINVVTETYAPLLVGVSVRREFAPVTTEKVRWYVPAYTNNRVRLYEIEVWGKITY